MLRSVKSVLRNLAGGAFGGRNFLSVSAGQVVLGLTQWGTLSVLALIGGASSVGELGFALAIVTPVYQLAKLRLRDVLATDIERKWPLGDYMGLTILAGAVALVVSLVIAAFLSGTATLVTVAAVAMSRQYESLSQISYGFQQRLDVMARIGVSLAARGVLSVLFVFVGFQTTGEVGWAAVGMMIANALMYYFYDRPAMEGEAAPGTYRVGGSAQMKLALLALPLGTISALAAMTDSIPRLMIEAQFGLAELGILASFGYVVVGSSYVTRALAAASGSRVAVALAAKNKHLFVSHTIRLLWLSFLAGVALIIGTYFFGEPFLEIAFGPEFAAFSFDFFLMSFYAMTEFLMTPLGVVLIAARRFRVQLLIQIASTLSVAVAGFILIPDLGVRGAVYALIIAGIVRVGLSAVESYRFIKTL
jgi:O-antigen/teichoic acid export membrane protein